MNFFRKTAFVSLSVALLGVAISINSCTNPKKVEGNGPLSLTIAHLNDTHASIEASTVKLKFDGKKTYSKVGGFTRLTTKVNNLRKENKNFLFLHAGDIFQGSLYFTKYKGMADLDFFEGMGLDAMCLGNHEFDKGDNLLSDFGSKVKFPVLSANIDFSADADLQKIVKPYTVKVIDGQKVAIIGLTVEQTPEISSPGDELIFLNVVESAKKYVAELTAKDINKIILLTHVGYEEDLQLAKSLSDVDIIIGGHSHTLLGDYPTLGLSTSGKYPAVVKNKDGDDVLIVQSWEKALALGVLNVDFDKEGKIVKYSGTPVVIASTEQKDYKQKNAEGKKMVVADTVFAAISKSIKNNPVIEMLAEDPEAKKKLDKYSAPIKELKETVIATCDADLYHVRVPGETHESGVVMKNGSAIAPIIADAMLWKAKSLGLKASIAIQNAGGVRVDVPKGNITIGDAYTILPFGNTLTVMELKGTELKQALVDGVTRSGGAFPYLSGMKFSLKKGADKKFKISDMLVLADDGKWKAFNDEAIYRFVTNSYTASGGDNYQIFKNSKMYKYDTGFKDAEVYMEYLKSVGSLKKVENRINVIK